MSGEGVAVLHLKKIRRGHRISSVLIATLPVAGTSLRFYTRSTVHVERAVRCLLSGDKIRVKSGGCRSNCSLIGTDII